MLFHHKKYKHERDHYKEKTGRKRNKDRIKR